MAGQIIEVYDKYWPATAQSRGVVALKAALDEQLVTYTQVTSIRLFKPERLVHVVEGISKAVVVDVIDLRIKAESR